MNADRSHASAKPRAKNQILLMILGVALSAFFALGVAQDGDPAGRWVYVDHARDGNTADTSEIKTYTGWMKVMDVAPGLGTYRLYNPQGKTPEEKYIDLKSGYLLSTEPPAKTAAEPPQNPAGKTTADDPTKMTGQKDRSCNPSKIVIAGDNENTPIHLPEIKSPPEEPAASAPATAQTPAGAQTPPSLPQGLTDTDKPDAARITTASIPAPVTPGDISLPLDVNNLGTLTQTANTAEDQEKQGRVDLAAQFLRENAQNAVTDQKNLGDLYSHIPLPVFTERLGKASSELADMESDIRSAVGGMSTGDLTRFGNIVSNAWQKAAGLKADLDQIQQRENSPFGENPFSGLLGMNFPNPITEALGNQQRDPAALLSHKMTPDQATSNDALVDRLIMLKGLPKTQEKELAGKLKLVERPQLQLPNGSTVQVTLPHNGYFFVHGTTGLNCSQFVSKTLAPELSKAQFTTGDFYSIWTYLRTGKFPKPPYYVEKRGDFVKSASHAFTPVDLDMGDTLEKGDLLVKYLPWTPKENHVFLIEEYNGTNLQAQVIEASQSAGTIRERNFSLSLDPLDKSHRVLRAGLFALRPRTEDNKFCRYSDHRKPTKGGAL